MHISFIIMFYLNYHTYLVEQTLIREGLRVFAFPEFNLIVQKLCSVFSLYACMEEFTWISSAIQL
jgi:hypothetical protein